MALKSREIVYKNLTAWNATQSPVDKAKNIWCYNGQYGTYV